MSKQLECRVIIRHRGGAYTGSFDLGMYDPLNERYEKLGNHPARDEEKEVRKLAQAIERAGHRVTFSEMRAD